MKKMLFLLSFLAVLTLSASIVKACPDWADYEQEYIFTVGDCEYIGNICWKCPAMGLGTMWIAISYVKPLDDDCDSPYYLDEVTDAIYEQINTFTWLLGLCTQSIPPCGQGYLEYRFIRYNCFFMRREDGIVNYYHCDYNTYCRQDWKMCWDNQTGPEPPVLVNDWYQVGTPNCTSTMPGIPLNDGETSTCWNYKPCD